MSFNPHYNVFPHGIHYDNQIKSHFAVFKMMITLVSKDGKEISDSNDLVTKWKEVKTNIDKLKWSYEFEQETDMLKFVGMDNAPSPTTSPIYFIHKYVDYSYSEDRSFNFGMGFIEEKSLSQTVYHDAFEPLLDIKRISLKWSPPKEPSQVLRQMGIKNEVGTNDDRFFGKDIYGTILSEVDKHSVNIGDPKSGEYIEDLSFFNDVSDKVNIPYLSKDNPRKQPDLMPTYASILNEPEVAEIRFGIIREFRIPIEVFSNGSIGNIDRIYTIWVNNEKAPFKCLLKRQTDKYYHGMKDQLFCASNFHQVVVQYVDPYDKYLNETDQKAKPHPDGMYMVVAYKSPNGSDEITDEHDPFEKESVKGFNIVTKVSDKKSYHSLSYHKKCYEFPKKDPCEYSIKTSGVLSPQGEILTRDSRYRANVLFGWRGDNLIVNRTVIKSTSDDDEFDQMETISEYETEGFMLSKELFTTDSELIRGSQLQLFDRRDRSGDSINYDFFLRTVSPTGHYLPLQSEVANRTDLLTFEDLVAKTKPFFSAAFEVSDINQIPIKKLSIIGSEKDQTAGTEEEVDGHQHLVIREQFEQSQAAILKTSRFIHPPTIKFEDFRYHGWLSKDRLNNPAEDVFIDLCLKYQKRSNTPTPALLEEPPQIKNVGYLADMRGDKLLIVPGDLFTINYLLQNGRYSSRLSLFEYFPNHPYYRNTLTAELRFERYKKNDRILNRLSIIKDDPNSSIEINDDLPDGIYNLRFYSTDNAELEYVFKNDHSHIDIKISAVATPPAPLLETDDSSSLTFVTDRINDTNLQNSWFHQVTLNSSPNDGIDRLHLWKSIKHTEKITTLRLTENEKKLKELMEQNLLSDPLMIHEYPYELFLEEEEDKQLKTSIYPWSVDLKFRMSRSLFPANDDQEIEMVLIKLRLSDKDTLFVHRRRDNQFTLEVNSKKISNLRLDESHKFRIVFDKKNYCFQIEGQSITEPWKLSKPYDPDISVNSFEIDESIFDHFIFFAGANEVNLTRSDKFIFIHNEGHPYYRKKSVTLFGSSIFQAYYPSLQDELKIGTAGTTFELEIPNNIKPSTPVLESDILLVQKPSIKGNAKEYKVENVVRLLLEKDFMKEGKNKLGIVVRKVGNKDYKTESTEPLNSEIGEDITKLTTVDWSRNNLEDAINFEHDLEEVDKYFSDKDKYFYKIAGDIYEVLECEPFYNTQLKKWQVLIPLQLRRTETLFVKFSAIKISPGHSMKGDRTFNTEKQPFIDETTNTNWSLISDSTQIPVYGAKHYAMEPISGYSNQIKITNKSTSMYENKTYCILVKASDDSVLNVIKSDSSDRLTDFVEFSFRVAESGDFSTERKKVLVSASIDSIYLDLDTKAKSILILEFENHENSTRKGDEKPELSSDINPLFDLSGIRLINMVEFKLI